eukprot:2975243-Ditylum_brightwellii.AAC.1
MLEKQPLAVLERNEEGLTPLDIASICDAPEDTQSLLSHVYDLVYDRSDDSIAEEKLEVFTDIEWWNGVSLALDMHPTIIPTLNLSINIMPDFLSTAGRCCK